MRPLSDNDIESELSYAYLHAIASKTGAGCCVGNRHSDNAGVDARLTGWGPFPGGGYRNEVDLNVQLKATIGVPVDNGTHFSFLLSGIERYNDLRSDALSTPRILVVLFLPPNRDEWLSLDENELVLRKAAYWVSLRGAPASTNATAQTVYLPKRQIFNPEGLIGLFTEVSNNRVPAYEAA